MKQPLRLIRTVAQGLFTLFLILVLLCNLSLIIMKQVMGIADPALFGYSAAVIVSGSMEPALSVNDLIFSHAQEQYARGDIITFRSGDNLTTHRIAAVTGEGYVTRGDANSADDPDLVEPEEIVGRVVADIPHAGGMIVALKTPFGMTAAVLGGAAITGLSVFVRKGQGCTVKEDLNENKTTEILS